MSKIVALHRVPASASREVIDVLTGLLEVAREGRITGLIFGLSLPDNAYFRVIPKPDEPEPNRKRAKTNLGRTQESWTFRRLTSHLHLFLAKPRDGLRSLAKIS